MVSYEQPGVASGMICFRVKQYSWSAIPDWGCYYFLAEITAAMEELEYFALLCLEGFGILLRKEKKTHHCLVYHTRVKPFVRE